MCSIYFSSASIVKVDDYFFLAENGEIENGDGQQMVDDELIETSKKTSKGSNSLLSQSKDLDSCKDAKSADEDEPLLNDSPKKSSGELLLKAQSATSNKSQKRRICLSMSVLL